MNVKMASRPSKHKRPKRNPADVAFYCILFIILSVFSIFIVFMLVWGVLTSLKSPDDFQMNNNVLGFPNLDSSNAYNSLDQFLRFSNYVKIFQNFKFDSISASFYSGSTQINHYAENVDILDMLINTLIYAGGGALILSFMPALTAYLTAKYEFRFSKIVFFVFTLIMCIPIVGAFPSEVTFLRNTGLYDNLFGNFLRYFSGAGVYYFVYYAFFKGQSNTYREAAEIDGAGEGTIMLKIYLPMAAKIIGTVFLIQFVALWNDFQTPMLYLPTHPTLAYGVFELTKSSSKFSRELQYVPLRITGCMILAVPINVLFLIFKNKLMGNISAGGIKE